MCRTKMCLPLTGRLSLDRSGPETAGDAVREPLQAYGEGNALAHHDL